MTIPSVMHGLIETENGKVFELDSARGKVWLESALSFRFEPAGDNKPYTVRKESGKGGDYWYGYRKQNGRLHKKYIGKSSELSTAKLEEIAEALNTPPQPRVTNKVTEVTEGSKRVTDRVTDTRDGDRLTALELQVQALQESLEALRGELPGKSDAGNSEELSTVTESGLQIEIGNLQAENQSLKQELEAELEIERTARHIAEADAWALKERLAELRSELEQERADREEVEAELAERKDQMRQLLSELSDLKQKSATGREFPDAADLLNQLKAKRKKVGASLADVELILEILGDRDKHD